MRNTNKKGFTVVELVIVVAVIAILAAVLIPTFSGIIAKAQLSADKKAVHEMNTFIAMEQADTFEEALAALEKNKINTENLSPISAGYSFVWNNETKTIDLVETKEDTVDIIESIKNEAITVSTSDYLTLAVANGSKNVTIGADLTVTSGVTALAGTEINLDLGGNTLTTGMSDATKHHYAFNVYGTVTLTNGTVDARGIKIFDGGKLILGEGVTVNHVDDNGGACLWVYEGAEVVVDGGEFIAANGKNTVETDPAVISNFGGKITINDGKFETTKSYAYVINNFSGEIEINGGEFNGYRGVVAAVGGKVTINDGNFTVTGDYAKDKNVCYPIYVSNGSVVITDGTFAGGIKNYCVDSEGTGSITLPDGTIIDNKAE